MAKSRSFSPSDEEVINHYGSVRLHATGAGNLRMALYSLDDLKTTTLLPLVLKAKNEIEPTRLSNFTQQKARLEIRTTAINEFFHINNIVVFVRPVAKSYPG